MKESRVLQTIWQLTLLLSLAEISYGLYAGSLGLVSDGVHSGANCLGVGTSLYAVRFAKSFSSKSYSYDIGMRAEVLAAFTNSVMLFLLSAFLAFEAFHKLIEDAHHSDHGDHVAYVALAGVIVNVFGLRLVSPLIGGWYPMWKRLLRPQQEKTFDQNTNSGPRLLNLEAVALHIICDIFSSLGVILSIVMSEQFDSRVADSLVAVLIAALTVRAATPMFKRTARMLAQASSQGFRPDPLLRELSTVDGVLEFYQVHFWCLAPGRDVSSMIVRVRADADADAVLRAAYRIFSPHLWSITIQIEREKQISSLPVVNRMNNSMSNNQLSSLPTLSRVSSTEALRPSTGVREAAHIL